MTGDESTGAGSGPLDELVDPALASAVLEIEEHIATGGWDQPARLYALVPTAELVAKEPVLAHAMGLDEAAAAGSLTPVEQEPLGADLERSLESITWPSGVSGCAAVVERLVLPPDAEATVLEDPDRATTFAREHPDRQDVRIVAGATRAGATYCALRLRAADDDQSVLTGAELVPGLLALLRDTLEDDAGQPPVDPDVDPPAELAGDHEGARGEDVR
jgi:hypothetical protein